MLCCTRFGLGFDHARQPLRKPSHCPGNTRGIEDTSDWRAHGPRPDGSGRCFTMCFLFSHVFPHCNRNSAVTAAAAVKAKAPTTHRRRGRRGKSVYRGVCVTREGKWRAVIYKERKQVCLVFDLTPHPRKKTCVLLALKTRQVNRCFFVSF